MLMDASMRSDLSTVTRTTMVTRDVTNDIMTNTIIGHIKSTVTAPVRKTAMRGGTELIIFTRRLGGTMITNTKSITMTTTMATAITIIANAKATQQLICAKMLCMGRGYLQARRKRAGRCGIVERRLEYFRSDRMYKNGEG